jgi:hypothetical protein
LSHAVLGYCNNFYCRLRQGDWRKSALARLPGQLGKGAATLAPLQFDPWPRMTDD